MGLIKHRLILKQYENKSEDEKKLLCYPTASYSLLSCFNSIHYLTKPSDWIVEQVEDGLVTDFYSAKQLIKIFTKETLPTTLDEIVYLMLTDGQKEINNKTMKKYLQIIVTAHDGRVYNNDLTLSETHLITTIVKENKSALVSLKECTKETYKILFGK